MVPRMNSEGAKSGEGIGRFDTLSLLYLTLGCAVWLTYWGRQKEWQLPGIVLLSCLAVALAAVAQLVFWLTRVRWVAPLTCICGVTAMSVALGIIGFLFSSQLDAVGATCIGLSPVIGPIPELFQTRRLACFAVASVLVPAHPLRPGIPTALVTSMGVVCWASAGATICLRWVAV